MKINTLRTTELCEWVKKNKRYPIERSLDKIERRLANYLHIKRYAKKYGDEKKIGNKFYTQQ